MFAGLDRRLLQEIADALTPETWPARYPILSPASVPDRFRIVVSGRVKISRFNGSSGRDLTLWLLGPGAAFDTVTLMDGQAHAVSALALDDVRTLAAPVTRFQDWIERHAALRRSFCHYVSEQMRELTELASDLALQDTMTRLARVLLRYRRHTEPSGIEVPNLLEDLSQEELASLVGSVRVVVSRLLGQLRREGTIEFRRGALHVTDIKRLLEHAEGSPELRQRGRRALAVGT